MRAAMTFLFGWTFGLGSISWQTNALGECFGNPSISSQVSYYMNSLRRRKVSFSVPFLTSKIQELNRFKLERQLQALEQLLKNCLKSFITSITNLRIGQLKITHLVLQGSHRTGLELVLVISFNWPSLSHSSVFFALMRCSRFRLMILSSMEMTRFPWICHFARQTNMEVILFLYLFNYLTNIFF